MTDPAAALGAELLALARPLAEEVAAHLLGSLDGAGPAVASKSSPTDLVTELDTWAEARITEVLLAARPHDSIRGEEGADISGTSEVTWSIDPIDGTVNFVHGLPGFCVSIAAMVGDDVVAGVVVSPLHHDVFTAVRGAGAHRNDRPIRCAAPVPTDRSVVATGFGYDPARRLAQAEVLTRVLPRIADIRRGGAAAIDLCWVGAGRLDGYWEVGLNHWDHAAGALVASEAGARCAALDGAAPSEASILAAPPGNWDGLAELLLGAGADQV